MASLTDDSLTQTTRERGSASDAFSSVDQYSYDDSIVRSFLTATVLWGLVATLVGLIVAVLLVLPKLVEPLGWMSQLLSFGRLRPLHTNAAIFAFGGNAIFAAVYYGPSHKKCNIGVGGS